LTSVTEVIKLVLILSLGNNKSPTFLKYRMNGDVKMRKEYQAFQVASFEIFLL